MKSTIYSKSIKLFRIELEDLTKTLHIKIDGLKVRYDKSADFHPAICADILRLIRKIVDGSKSENTFTQENNVWRASQKVSDIGRISRDFNEFFERLTEFVEKEYISKLVPASKGS